MVYIYIAGEVFVCHKGEVITFKKEIKASREKDFAQLRRDLIDSFGAFLFFVIPVTPAITIPIVWRLNKDKK